MLNKIKDLLKDTEVRQKIKEAKTQDEVNKLLIAAGTEKGDNFTVKDITKMLAQLEFRQFHQLREEDLLDLVITACKSTSYDKK